jgi:hypothetical protein
VGLNTIMTHKARLLTREATGQVVEGTKTYSTTEGAWFRCRLFPDETAEQEGQRGGRRMLMKGPHVVVGVKDSAGNPILPGDITPAKLMEIDAKVLGVQTWQVSSDPQPLLTKTRLLGYYFAVKRAETAGAASA